MRKAACHFFLLCFNHAATHSNVEISLDVFCCAMLDCILSPLDCDPCPHSVWNMALSQKFPFSFKNLWVFPLQPDVLTTVLVLAAGPSLPPLHTKLLFWSLTGSLQSSHNKHRESKAPLPPPPSPSVLPRQPWHHDHRRTVHKGGRLCPRWDHWCHCSHIQGRVTLTDGWRGSSILWGVRCFQSCWEGGGLHGWRHAAFTG